MGGAWAHPQQRPIPAERHVFCRIGKEEYGIPLLVDLLSRHGFRGTFFVETLATGCLGTADTRSIFDFLLARNQDVQLHMHPTYHYYSEWLKAQAAGIPYRPPEPNDLIGLFPKETQLGLFTEAIRYFAEFAGARPTAFRAGCYAASRTTLECLAELGIPLDSSLNSCYPDISFPGESFTPNQVRKIAGTWEFPVTVAHSPLPEGQAGFKFADCTSLAASELETMLDAAAGAGQEHFIIVFHSFSAVKAKDMTYAELRPNRIVIHRLERLFRYLAENSGRFEVSTLGDAAEMLRTTEPSSAGKVAELGLVRAAMRKGVQLLNGRYWI